MWKQNKDEELKEKHSKKRKEELMKTRSLSETKKGERKGCTICI